MGLGFKYHVVTIAAIFFALTIGMVVGSLFGSPRIPQTTMIAIEALKKSQAALEKNTSEVKQERDSLQTSLHQALPFAIKGRLSGISLAIVQTSGEASELTADVRDTLTQAGARIVSVTLLERPFNQPDELLLPRLTAQRDTIKDFPANRADIMSSLASVLQNGETPPPTTGAPGLQPFIPQLREGGFIRSEADSHYDPNVAIRAVVLLTGSRSEATSLAQNVDVPLITALQKTTLQSGLPVYACEAQDVVTSSFSAYRAAGLPVTTIDRANTDPGRWQLVTALANLTP